MFFKTAPARHLKSYVRAPSYLLPYRRISQNTPHSVRPVVAIKRETVNLWEQRSPLVPNQVKQLVQNGVRVLVQPSNRRCFSATEFEAAGAIMQEDIHEASLILGVKRPTELRSTDLLPEKTYAFFTHTIKAQPDNMEMLDTLLERSEAMTFVYMHKEPAGQADEANWSYRVVLRVKWKTKLILHRSNSTSRTSEHPRSSVMSPRENVYRIRVLVRAGLNQASIVRNHIRAGNDKRIVWSLIIDIIGLLAHTQTISHSSYE